MKNLRYLAFGVMFISLMLTGMQLSGCAGKSPKAEDKYSTDPVENMDPAAQEKVLEETPAAADEGGQTQAPPKDNIPTPETTVTPEKNPQKMIKTAEISFQVSKYEAARKKILDIIKTHKAYISSEDQSTNDYRLSNTVIIRVDAAGFDALVEDLMKESVFVDYKKVNATDVSEEYVDIQARLKSKRAAEQQYEEILKKAGSIRDVLEVQQYLRTIREEIESLEGRMRFINDRVAYSTITLTFYEKSDKVSIQPGRSFGSRLAEALGWGWQGLMTFVVAVVYLWPFWLVTAVVLLVLFRVLKRSRRKKLNK
jgi:hypothetical protein